MVRRLVFLFYFEDSSTSYEKAATPGGAAASFYSIRKISFFSRLKIRFSSREM